MSLFSKFNPIAYRYTSSYNLEICIVSMRYDEKEKDQNMKIKKKLNLREVINLQLASKSQVIRLNKADNRIFLANLHDLANFLIFKIKTSNLFNISLSMKDDDKQSERDEEEHSGSESYENYDDYDEDTF